MDENEMRMCRKSIDSFGDQRMDKNGIISQEPAWEKSLSSEYLI